MTVILFTLILWMMVGFAIARYALQQHEWIQLIFSSMALGMLYQILLLNALAHFFDVPESYWISAGVMVLSAGSCYVWGRNTILPLELGLSRRLFVLVLGFIVFLMFWIFWPLYYGEFYDSTYHFNLAGVIGNGGLPVKHPWNPEFCTFYHYGVDLMATALFRVADFPLWRGYDLITGWSVTAVLGLAFNFMWQVSAKKLVVTGILGMCLLLMAGGASWISVPFTHPTIREVTENVAAFSYFHNMSQNKSFLNDYWLGYSTFNNAYVLALHTRSMNPAWLCVLLVFNIFLSTTPGTKGTLIKWVIVGLLLGAMSLFYEAFWVVPVGMIGLYGLYLLYMQRSNWRNLILHFGTIAVISCGLAIFQGTVITDTLFCHESQLSADSEQVVTQFKFPAGPGYFSWAGYEYISLAQPRNWLRWISEWGIAILLVPILFYHYFKRRHILIICLLISNFVPVLLLAFSRSDLGVDSGRIAVLPLWLFAALTADWLTHLWEKGKWQRVVAGGLFIGMAYSGAALLFALTRMYVNDPDPTYLSRAIDQEIQENWYGKVGDREDKILYLGFNAIPGRIQDDIPLLFGNYTLTFESRSTWDFHPGSVLATGYPRSDLLTYFNIEYIYFDQDWWEKRPPDIEALLNDKTQFEQIFWIEEGDQMRALYRRIAPRPANYPEWFSLLNVGAARELNSTDLVYYYAIRTWKDLVSDDTVVFHPAFHLAPEIQNYLPGLSTQRDLGESYQIGIDAWRETKSPEALQKVGISYFILDSTWFSFASEGDIIAATDPEKVELVHEWSINRGGSFIRLYRYVE